MTWTFESPKNFHFNSLLLSKVYIVWAKKVQRSFLWWNWRGIQNLERNWLVVSRLTKEFDKFWPEHLKVSNIFTLIVSFWAKYVLFELKKDREGYLSWNWKGIKNLERNWLVNSRLTWGIWQILTWALESLKKFHFNRLFLSKLCIVWANKV